MDVANLATVGIVIVERERPVVPDVDVEALVGGVILADVLAYDDSLACVAAHL